MFTGIQTTTYIISLITALQLLLFSFFLLSLRENKTSSRILSSILIANAIFILNFLIKPLENYFNIALYSFYFIGHVFGYLFGPLLFFFTKSLTYKNFKFRRQDVLHLVLFSAYAFLIIFRYTILTSEEKVDFVTHSRMFPGELFPAIMLVMHIQIFVYMAACIKLIVDYRKELQNHYSSLENINLSWLLLVFYTFILMWLVDLVHFVFGRVLKLPEIVSQLLTFISLSINFVFAFLLEYRGLKHPELFFKIEQKRNGKKYEGSSLTKAESEGILRRLKTLMEDEKPFLIASLTINNLAEKLAVSSKVLSQVINENLKQNFFDFVNSYRIASAKEFLSDPANKKTVLEVLYENGFNSKSVFNTAFKKHTGMTPTAFRRTAKLISSR